MKAKQQKKLSTYERHEKIFTRLIIGNLTIIIPTLIYSRVYGLILIAFSLYCWICFYKGYKSQVVDEWEVGYFYDGIRYLRKGIIILAIIATGIYLIFF